MKVHLDNVDLTSRTGPNTFASRLARELFVTGHEVTFEARDADVSLVFIEPSGAPLAPKVVQRLDGVWFKPDEFVSKNRGIKSLYDQADAVVWQSDFDRRMTTRHWGRPAGGAVVLNGTDVAHVNEVTNTAVLSLRANHDRVYVSSSNWHPQKRMGANYALFKRLQARHPRSCLVVMGANPPMVADPDVYYAGSVGRDVYLQVYSIADWMLHLAWADHCPNVVVEALSQGTPVACSDVGGTKELVGGYGVVLKDEPYDFGLADYDDPPVIDVTQVVDLPPRQQLDYSSIADIDIRNVARSYVELFDRVCV